jgi:hypothetical protein
VYCLCVNMYCHRVSTQLQLTNISVSKRPGRHNRKLRIKQLCRLRSRFIAFTLSYSAIDQRFCRRPDTAEPQVPFEANPCRMCVKQSDDRIRFVRVHLILPASVIPITQRAFCSSTTDSKPQQLKNAYLSKSAC